MSIQLEGIKLEIKVEKQDIDAQYEKENSINPIAWSSQDSISIHGNTNTSASTKKEYDCEDNYNTDRNDTSMKVKEEEIENPIGFENIFVKNYEMPYFLCKTELEIPKMASDSECDDLDSEHSESDSSSLPSSTSEDETGQSRHDLSDEWTEINIQTDTPAPPGSFEFTGNSCINDEILPFTQPYQFFNYFFNDELVQNIVDETNLFFVQMQNKTPSTSNGDNQWKTSVSEMRTFFAITMSMSIVHKPEEKLYWMKKHSILTPFFAKVMSQRRYAMIKKFLHFVNNEKPNPANHPQPKLSQIWPVYEHLKEKFQQAYTPDQNINIHDSQMMDKGKLGVQYNPVRHAIKSYFLCESKSGYIWSSLIYTKGTIVGDPQFMNLAISTQIVMNLMKPLLSKGHCLTVDSFYTSVELAELLILLSTDTCGKMKPNRKDIPKNIMHPRKIRRGHISAYRKRKIMIIRWKDKRDVIFLSTIHGTDQIVINKKNTRIRKPKVVADFNSTMRSIDRVDQHLSNYSVTRKQGKQYHKKMFFRLMEQAIWNAFVLYTKQVGSMSHLDFRLQLIDEYIENYHKPEYSSNGGRPSKNTNPLRLTERHFLEPIPMTQKKSAPTKRCVVCCSKQNERGKRIRRESRYHCADCNVGLCLTPCFKLYHTQLDF